MTRGRRRPGATTPSRRRGRGRRTRIGWYRRGVRGIRNRDRQPRNRDSRVRRRPAGVRRRPAGVRRRPGAVRRRPAGVRRWTTRGNVRAVATKKWSGWAIAGWYGWRAMGCYTYRGALGTWVRVRPQLPPERSIGRHRPRPHRQATRGRMGASARRTGRRLCLRGARASGVVSSTREGSTQRTPQRGRHCRRPQRGGLLAVEPQACWMTARCPRPALKDPFCRTYQP